jgi:hypothetical protein
LVIFFQIGLILALALGVLSAALILAWRDADRDGTGLQKARHKIDRAQRCWGNKN